MQQFPIAEYFISINGEGQHAGKLAMFLRMRGCNLRCSYCDTMWANEDNCNVEWLTVQEICSLVKAEGVQYVTVTGGEPLLQENIHVLLSALSEEVGVIVEVETNGSVPIAPFQALCPQVQFTTDYKLPSSGMEIAMHVENLCAVRQTDTLKFVCGSVQDLMRVKELMRGDVVSKDVPVYLSPVFGEIEPATIVDFVKEHLRTYPQVRVQLQLHKMIWPTIDKGV